MNVSTQRFIDRWIGVPVCLALTVWDKLFGRRPPKRPPRNVLIVQLSEMGSLTLAYPSIRHLKALFPEARVHFVTFRRNRKFLDLLEVAEPGDVFALDDASLGAFVASVWRFMREARRRRIDTTLDFELFTRVSTIVAWLSGARRRAGFDNYLAEGLYRGRLLTHRVHYNVYKHISLNFAAMVRALSHDRPEQPALKEVVEIDLTLPKKRVAPEAAQAMRERLRALYPDLTDKTRIVVLSPISGNLLPIRAWPQKNYIEFIRGLFERTGDTIAVMIGLPEDADEYVQPIVDGVGSPRLVDFIGHTADIGEVIQLFSISHLFVSTDSGPPHFASMTDIPTIVMFGPECPMLYAPLGPNIRTVFLGMDCSPCVSAFNHRNTPCTDNRCMQEIAPAKILEMSLEILEGRDEVLRDA